MKGWVYHFLHLLISKILLYSISNPFPSKYRKKVLWKKEKRIEKKGDKKKIELDERFQNSLKTRMTLLQKHPNQINLTSLI